jgi:hypothetical protein
VAHSAGPFSQEWAVTSRRTHGPPEDLLDDWGSCEFLSSFRQSATTIHLDATQTEPGRHGTLSFTDTKVSLFRADSVRHPSAREGQAEGGDKLKD